MKTASIGLINLLAQHNTYAMWETYTFTFSDGSTVTWTSGDLPRIPLIGFVPCDLLLHFDEADPTQWIDYSTNRRALTLNPHAGSIVMSELGLFNIDSGGGVRLVGPDPEPGCGFVQAHPGRRESIYYGTHSFISVDGSISPGANDFFIEFSCVFLGTTNDFGYCVFWNIHGGGGFYIYFIPLASDPTNLQLVFSAEGSSGSAREVRVNNTEAFVGRRKRYAVSRVGQVLTFFVDGDIFSQSTQFDIGESILDSTRSFVMLGCADTGTTGQTIDSFNGTIDEFYMISGPGTGRTAAYTPTTVEYGRA